MKKQFTFKILIIVIAMISTFVIGCKKGKEPIPTPIDQQTWAQLAEDVKISFFQTREFTMASTETKNGSPSIPKDCIGDNSFFIGNGSAQIYYGNSQCTIIDDVFNKTSRFSQKFVYNNNTLTIGNIYRDNAISGDVTFVIKSVDETRKQIVLECVEGSDTFQRAYNYTDKQTTTPAKYIRP